MGRVGSRIAHNLARAGHQIRVWNRTVSVAEQWATDNGADVADSLSDLAADNRVLITMLADGDALAEVYEGEGGLAWPRMWVSCGPTWT